MKSFLRALLLALTAWLCFSIVASQSAFAQELRPLDIAGRTSDRPAPILPSDVPFAVSGTHIDLPPVPSSYVTKDLGWLTLSYPRAAAERVAPLEAEADTVKRAMVAAFEAPVLSHVEVRITPTVADMARLAPASVPPPTYASGVAYRGLQLVLISMLEPRGAEAVDLPEVFRHELAHVALEEAAAGHHVPVWFNEGLAISLSGENRYDRLQLLVKSTLAGQLLPLSELDRSFPADHAAVGIAYAESADFVRFLDQKADHARFVSMVSRVHDGDAFDRALADAYGSDLRKLEFQWRSQVEHRYSIWPLLAGGSLIWGVVMVVLVLAYAKKKRRTKAILAKWGREDEVEDALRARAALAESEELLQVTVSQLPSVKIVADDGAIHTLH